MKAKYRKVIKRMVATCLILFLIMNMMAIFHAYKFTHFAAPGTRPKLTKDSGIGQKIKALFFGINIPKPQNKLLPEAPYENVILNGFKKTACWWIKTDLNTPKGTVIIFHGYVNSKSGMLDKAAIFRSLGYNTFLIDFMGNGDSEGNQCTIGFKEATQVKMAFDYIQSKGEKNIVLFGTSMGSAAVMKAMQDYRLQANSMIVECPFGTMLETVQARFRMFHAPVFPMSQLFVFWGGLENGFNGFKHNPEEYAKHITIPTLLLWGEKDETVSRPETEMIYQNLQGKKKLVTYPNAGHENYLTQYRKEWTNDVANWLNQDVTTK